MNQGLETLAGSSQPLTGSHHNHESRY